MKIFAAAWFIILLVYWAEGKLTQQYTPISTYIVGGRPALQDEVPYQLSLQRNGSHTCGAALVEMDGFQIGITSANCIEIKPFISYDVIAGELNRNEKTGLEQQLSVKQVLVHQNYSAYTLQNDIAILLLNGSFQLNGNVTTVPLPKQGQKTDQGNITVSGWGSLFPGGAITSELRIVEIPLVNHTECQKIYKDYIFSITDNMICAGAPGGGIGPCKGDSGGPAISEDGYLAGLVSWVYQAECAHLKFPTVFTSVSQYIDWIHAAVQYFKYSI